VSTLFFFFQDLSGYLENGLTFGSYILQVTVHGILGFIFAVVPMLAWGGDQSKTHLVSYLSRLDQCGNATVTILQWHNGYVT
jgi:hypothetical protein